MLGRLAARGIHLENGVVEMLRRQSATTVSISSKCKDDRNVEVSSLPDTPCLRGRWSYASALDIPPIEMGTVVIGVIQRRRAGCS